MKGMIIKKTITIGAAITALALTNSYSFAHEPEDKFNFWRDCGIGAIVFPDNGIAAAISNATFGLGITAVTSALAVENNCDDTRVQTARFVAESLPNLEEDIVKGEGQHLTVMLNLMGCEAAQQNVVSSAIRNDFSSVMSNPAYPKMNLKQKAESLFTVAENAATSSCKVS